VRSRRDSPPQGRLNPLGEAAGTGLGDERGTRPSLSDFRFSGSEPLHPPRRIRPWGPSQPAHASAPSLWPRTPVALIAPQRPSPRVKRLRAFCTLVADFPK
jgi:hypothetical protein